MSRSLITVLRCDRCGYERTSAPDGSPDRAGWGMAGASVSDQKVRIGAEDGVAADLCAGCAAALFEWWRAPTTPQAQPPAPTPPPPPAMTIEDRRHAIAATVAALRDRTAFIVEAVRVEPTAMLDGLVIPGTLAGIDEAAAAIVDGVLDHLRIPVPGRRA